MRCPKCGKLLAKTDAKGGRVVAFCRPCGKERMFAVDAPALRVVRA